MKSQLFKATIGLSTFTLSLFAFSSKAHALNAGSFVNYTVPVRHLTPSLDAPQTTLDFPQALHKQATHSATPVTWLIDQKVLDNQEELEFFQQLDSAGTDQVGLLLEVNPAWRNQAKVPPPKSQLGYLLNSYSPQNRYRLIDHLFDQYFKAFGHFPKTVASSYIDSTSLSYLANQYSVNSALFSVPNKDGHLPKTDGFFPYFPYYPSKNNALVPAQSRQEKIPLVVSHWNPPALSGQPQFRLQDQLSWLDDSSIFYSLLADYSQKDLNEFTQLGFGVDNSVSPSSYIPVFKFLQKQFSKNQQEFTLRVSTVEGASDWYISIYPFTGPSSYYRSLSSDDLYLHYANPFYQISLEQSNGHAQINYLSIFNNIESETFAHQANLTSTLELSTYPLVSKGSPVFTPLDLEDTHFDSEYWDLIISFDQDLRFNPHNITSSFSIELPESQSYQEIKSNHSYIYKFDSNWAPYNLQSKKLFADILKIITALLIVLFITKLPPKKIINWLKDNKLIAATITLGTFLWSLTTVRSGLLTDYGLSFYRAHSHDSLFHLSLIESFKNSFWPLKNPNFHNTLIYNYHLIYDYLLALISKLFNISSLDLYFRIIPPLLTFAIGFFSNQLMEKLKFKKSQRIVSLILIFTAGSLGFIPSLFQSGSLFAGQSVFWSHQAIETLVNPPFAMSLLVLLIVLNLLQKWQEDLNLSKILIISVLTASLSLIKVYGWLLLLSAIAIVVFTKLIKSKNADQLIKLLLASLLFSLLLLLPFYQSSGQLPFKFKPLWFVRTMFAAPDRLNWEIIAQKWQDLTLGGSFVKALFIYAFGTVIFYLGNLGIRVLGLKYWLKSSLNGFAWQLIYFIVITGLLFPLVLIQPGNSWNAIQFIYYPLFFLALFTGPVIVDILGRSHTLPKFLVLLSLFSLLTFPTTVGVLKDYLSHTPSSRISSEQLRSLHFLSQQPAGITLTPPFQLVNTNSYSTPKPIYAYSSTAFVPALTGQSVFMADQLNLEIMSYQFKDELKNAQRFYQSSDASFANKFIKENNIKYVTALPLKKPKSETDKLNLDLIFDSAYYPIYTVNR